MPGRVLRALSAGFIEGARRHAGITFEYARKDYGNGSEPIVRVTLDGVSEDVVPAETCVVIL
ncbi:hypothetical protein AFM16_09100 [Streptomyces antibioticus]|uniref:Uncharacterized protein n=1 Tax=Streptomyces antibioticus TaxID=1890 RepID=A0ABX3LSY3_STRAT|nr:hypothetical protein AFM16_09100 [Streptomyces antibioticus]